MVRKFLVLAARYAFLGVCLFLSSCDETTVKDYAYQDIQLPYPWGTLSVYLRGTEQDLDRSTVVKGSPYYLVVSMAKDAENVCQVNLESLHLIDTDNQTIPLSASQRHSFFTLKNADKYYATFVFNDVSLNYDTFLLDVKFSIEGGPACNQTEQLKLPIKKDYKEYKIGLWSQ